MNLSSSKKVQELKAKNKELKAALEAYRKVRKMKDEVRIGNWKQQPATRNTHNWHSATVTVFQCSVFSVECSMLERKAFSTQ